MESERNFYSGTLTAVIRFVIWVLELIGIIKPADPDDDDYNPARAADDVGTTFLVLLALPGIIALLLLALVLLI